MNRAGAGLLGRKERRYAYPDRLGRYLHVSCNDADALSGTTVAQAGSSQDVRIGASRTGIAAQTATNRSICSPGGRPESQPERHRLRLSPMRDIRIRLHLRPRIRHCLMTARSSVRWPSLRVGRLFRTHSISPSGPYRRFPADLGLFPSLRICPAHDSAIVRATL